MKNLTEEKLIKLGFKRQDVSEENTGDGIPYYYYTYDIKELCLISNSSDECVNGKWWVELFDSPNVGKFRDINKLSDFIKLLKSLRK